MKKIRYKQHNVCSPVFKYLLFMKVTALFLLIPFLQLSAKGYSQEKFSLNLDQVEAAKVFANIQKISAYRFFYLQNDIKKIGKINIHVTDATIPEIMQKVLGNTLAYKILNSYMVVISPSQADLVSQIDVRGRVTDDAGEPLQGASVKVKGHSVGVTTEADGSFSIAVDEKAVLEISMVGYETIEITVNGRNQLNNIVLKVAASGLDEVIITALGIPKEKKSLSYGISTINGTDITTARTNNMINNLSGKVPGLNVTSSATGPGSSSRVIIRGNTSLSGENQPLYVVDGIPMDNSNRSWAGMWGGRDGGDGIQMINPDDIETISVLKGGAAAALYGSRSSAGVILITTKKGSKTKKASVEMNSNAVVEAVMDITDWQYKYGHGIQGNAPQNAQTASSISPNSWGAKLDGSNVIQWDGVIRPYISHKNNIKKFYKPGTNLNNSISVNGGSDKMIYNFNISDLRNNSVIPNSTLSRNNFSLNVGLAPTDKLSVSIVARYIRERAKNRPRVSDSPGNANYTLYTMPTSWDVETFKTSMIDSITGGERKFNGVPYVTNPYWATYKFKQEDSRDRLIGALESKYDFTDWLYVRGRLSTDIYTRSNLEITPWGTQYSPGGQINIQSTERFREFNGELLIGGERTFSDFGLDAFLGANMMRSNFDGQYFSGDNFYTADYYYINNLKNKSTNSAVTKIHTNSIFSSAEISYKRFLFLTLTGRNDWFSTLSPDYWSNFYPSVGLSYVLSDAFSLPEAIEYAKIRTSWSKVSGQREPYGLSLSYNVNSNPYNGLPVGGIATNTIPNRKLKPYDVVTFEMGLDIRMLKNRLGMDITLYDRQTKNDIVSSQISQTSGYANVLLNVGRITNKGIELLLTGTPIRSKFNWDITYSMSYNDSRVNKISEQLNSLQIDMARSMTAFVNHIEGKPFGQIMAYDFKRNKSGRLLLNNGGLPQRGELLSFGTGVSPWLIGLNNSFRYGNLSFEFLIDSRFGGYIYSGTNDGATLRGVTKMTLEGRDGIIADGIVESTGEVNTKEVSAQSYWQSIAMNISTPFVYKSDFIKLRQMVLSYKFPEKLFTRSFVRGASVSLAGRNLLILMKKTPNIDPESSYNVSNAQGLEWFGAPPVRSIGINVNVKF